MVPLFCLSLFFLVRSPTEYLILLVYRSQVFSFRISTSEFEAYSQTANRPILSPGAMLSKLATGSVYTQPSIVNSPYLKTAVLTSGIPGTPNSSGGHW